MEVVIFIKQLSRNLNFLCIKDEKNEQEMHRDASVFQHFLNAGTRAPHASLGRERQQNGRYPRKKAEKLSASENIQLAAKTCLGKIILEDKMSQMYEMTYCFSQGMGRTYMPGVSYALSCLVLPIISNCSCYYLLLYT